LKIIKNLIGELKAGIAGVAERRISQSLEVSSDGEGVENSQDSLKTLSGNLLQLNETFELLVKQLNNFEQTVIPHAKKMDQYLKENQDLFVRVIVALEQLEFIFKINKGSLIVISKEELDFVEKVLSKREKDPNNDETVNKELTLLVENLKKRMENGLSLEGPDVDTREQVKEQLLQILREKEEMQKQKQQINNLELRVTEREKEYQEIIKNFKNLRDEWIRRMYDNNKLYQDAIERCKSDQQSIGEEFDGYFKKITEGEIIKLNKVKLSLEEMLNYLKYEFDSLESNQKKLKESLVGEGQSTINRLANENHLLNNLNSLCGLMHIFENNIQKLIFTSKDQNDKLMDQVVQTHKAITKSLLEIQGVNKEELSKLIEENSEILTEKLNQTQKIKDLLYANYLLKRKIEGGTDKKEHNNSLGRKKRSVTPDFSSAGHYNNKENNLDDGRPNVQFVEPKEAPPVSQGDENLRGLLKKIKESKQEGYTKEEVLKMFEQIETKKNK
jgi:hypothetical protein